MNESPCPNSAGIAENFPEFDINFAGSGSKVNVIAEKRFAIS